LTRVQIDHTGFLFSLNSASICDCGAPDGQERAPLDNPARAMKTRAMQRLVTTFMRYFGNGVSFCVAFAGEGDRATFMTIARNV